MQKIQKFIIPAIIILIALAVGQGLYYSKKGGGSIHAISKDKAAEKAINYINTNFMESGTKAELKGVEEINGVYKIQLSVGGNTYTSYITKDGKILFPEGLEVSEEVASSDIPKKDKPLVQLFVMSFCPYGNQAEELMDDVVGLLKDKADIGLHYVIYDKSYCQSLVDRKQYSTMEECKKSLCLVENNNSWHCSMHGIQELNQDVRELCVQKYQNNKFWEFVAEINKTCGSGNVDVCWEGVASKTGIEIDKIKTCQKNEAVALLKSEAELNAKYSISGSPQLIINDKEYDGSRGAEAYKNAVCAGFNSAPKECETELSGDSGSASGGCE